MEIGYGIKIDLKPYRRNLTQVRQQFKDGAPRILFVLNRKQAKELGQMLIQMADAPRVD